jgi:hypothetical protein
MPLLLGLAISSKYLAQPSSEFHTTMCKVLMNPSNQAIYQLDYSLMCASVGRVSQFYDTCRVWFSQSNLQKGQVLPQKIFIKFLCGARVSTFFLKKLNWFHNAGSQKFQNRRLSFSGSHKPGIILYL